ncbi:MAG: hypothetical protein R3D29_15505 [Nitratireductor sp.]
MEERGYKSVAAEGFRAPGVVVSYTDDPDIQNGKKSLGEGLQIAAGAPSMRRRTGLSFYSGICFAVGLDKLANIERTAENFRKALDKVG